MPATTVSYTSISGPIGTGGRRERERDAYPGEGRRDRGRHRGQQPGLPPRPARLERHRADRQGAAPKPRRVDRPCVQLHLPDRPLQRDDAVHAGQRQAIPGPGGLHAERGHRGRPHPGKGRRAQAADGVEQVLGDRFRTPDAGPGQGTGSVHQRGDHPGRVLDARHRHRRFPARRHPDAGEGPGHGGPDRAAVDGGVRHRGGSWAGARGAHVKGRYSGRHRGHQQRYLEPADRADGARRCTR